MITSTRLARYFQADVPELTFKVPPGEVYGVAQLLAQLSEPLGGATNIAEIIRERYTTATSMAELFLDADYEHCVEGGWVLGSGDGPEVNWEEFRDFMDRYIPKLDDAKPLTAVAILGAMISRFNLRPGAIGIAMALFTAFRALENRNGRKRNPHKLAAQLEYLATVFPNLEDARAALQNSGFKLVGALPNNSTMLFAVALFNPLATTEQPCAGLKERRLRTLGNLLEKTSVLVSDCLGDREVTPFVVGQGFDTGDNLPPESEPKNCRCWALVRQLWRQRRVLEMLARLTVIRPKREYEIQTIGTAWDAFEREGVLEAA